MTDRLFGSPDWPDREPASFASETEMLRGVSFLPKLSTAFRDRVLTAATSAYREARRWTQAKQAASLLSLSLLASLLLLPFVVTYAVLRTDPWQLETGDELPWTAWSWRKNRELFGLSLSDKPASATEFAAIRRTNRSAAHNSPPNDVLSRLFIFDRRDTAPAAEFAPEPRKVQLLATGGSPEGFDGIRAVINARAKLPRAFGVREQQL